jgi:YD repeat-containing protein
VFHPDGTVTRTTYDSLGRTTLVGQYPNALEGETPVDLNQVQRTAHTYDAKGRLETIKAILPPGSAVPEQVTQMVYEDSLGGAPIVDSAGTQISANNAFIKEVRFPDRQTGQPSATGDHFLFKYYSDGSVAERIDQRGIVFRHKYDELGRRTETTVDDSAWFVPAQPGQPEFGTVGRISKITYTYTDDGLPVTVAAYTKDCVR